MKPIIVANWKANKTQTEAKTWLNETKAELEKLTKVEIVICPPFVTIPVLANELAGSVIKLGGQTVSSKPTGAFTGEVAAELLRGLVSHCIVGHSERRRYFAEDSNQVAAKIERLLANAIVPIVCVSDLTQLDDYFSTSQVFKENSEKVVFVYEPPSAISGGGDYHPEDPNSVLQNVEAIRSKVVSSVQVLYGGSVNKEAIGQFLAVSKINGVLVGKASLDPVEFVAISQIISSSVV